MNTDKVLASVARTIQKGVNEVEEGRGKASSNDEIKPFINRSSYLIYRNACETLSRLTAHLTFSLPLY